MNLIILGNGFDIANELQTGYGDFKTFVEQHNVELFEMLNQIYCKSDLWSNFEYALGYPNIKFLDKLDTLFGINNGIGEDFAADLKNMFGKWISSIDFSQCYQRFLLDRSDKYITFNYTETLEQVYEIDEKNIIHIHGRVAQHYYGIPLEVGHNNRNFSRPLLKATYKKVDEISKKLEKTICELAEKNEITDIKIVGHSFNDIDFLYFCIINEKFKEANWTFGCKTGRDFENAQQYAHRLGLDTKKYIIINSEQVFETKEM